MSNETKWIWSNNEGARPDREPISGVDNDPTRRMAGTTPGTMTNLGLSEEATQFQRHGATEARDNEVEPVVGWLVIVKGPGLGRSVDIERGRSSIGRGEDQRIRLPFGDRSMSRNHAQMVYDPRSRKFLLSEGEGTSLTRINGELLVGSAPLSGGELIDLGDDTQVRFVPFCGAHFDWADLASPREEAE